MYIPNNVDIYTGALTGALAGMGVSDRVPTSPVPGSYTGVVAVADAFAQCLDSLVPPFGPALPAVVLQLATSLSSAAWQDRAPQPSPDTLNPSYYLPLCNALLALGMEYAVLVGAVPNLPTIGKVLVDGSDTTADFLNPKIAAGAGITLAVLNPGANEQLEITATAASEDHKVSVTAADTTPGFLASKLSPGTSVVLALLNPGANEVVEINVPSATPTAHASTHLPNAVTDPLSTAAPATGIGGGNAVGVANAFARSDHDHTIRETGGPTDLTVGVIADGQSVQRVGSTLVGIPNDVISVPSPIMPVAAQTTRALPATFEGGAYRIVKRCTVAALAGRMTAGAVGATVRYALYQVPGGLESGVAALLATGTFASAGAATNFSIAIPGTVVEAGILYVLCGLGVAAPAFTSRVYTSIALDLLNTNLSGVPIQFTTAISSLIAPPVTFNPSVSAVNSAVSLIPIIRLN